MLWGWSLFQEGASLGREQEGSELKVGKGDFSHRTMVNVYFIFIFEEEAEA